MINVYVLWLQIVFILEENDSGWWKGADSNGSEGWFPSNFVERIYHESSENITDA